MFPSKFLQFPSILTHFHAANEKIQNGGRDLAISRGLVWVSSPGVGELCTVIVYKWIDEFDPRGKADLYNLSCFPEMDTYTHIKRDATCIKIKSAYPRTYWCLVTSYGVTEIAYVSLLQVMTCRLLGSKTLPIHVPMVTYYYHPPS